MSKLVVVHCICTLVRSVAVSYSVIIIQVMLQFVITKKSKFLAFFDSHTQAPIMAASLSLVQFIFILLTVKHNFLNNKYVLKHQGSSTDHFHLEKYEVFQNSCEFWTPLWFNRTSCEWRPSSTPRLRRSLSLWSKRGHLCLTKPDWDPVMDLTIHMDISRNPGPDSMAETIKDKSSLPSIERPYCQSSESQGCGRLSY